MPRALLSVTDKTGLVPFARGLADLGWELLSTGGTRRHLADAGLDVTEVAGATGFPEILGGRVKTLHPLVHGGLLGRTDRADDAAQMAAHGIVPIDLLCVNLYRFAEAAAGGLPEAETVEQVDIGGPAMIRSAAKNFARVAVVTDPAQYDRVLGELRSGASGVDSRRELAAAAFARTADYDAAIAAWFAGHPAESFPARYTATFYKKNDLRYGENPHQRAAFYAEPSPPPPPSPPRNRCTARS